MHQLYVILVKDGSDRITADTLSFDNIELANKAYHNLKNQSVPFMQITVTRLY